DVVNCDQNCMQATRLLPSLIEPCIGAPNVPGLAAPVAGAVLAVVLHLCCYALVFLQPERGVDIGLDTLWRWILLHMPGDCLLTLFVGLWVGSEVMGHDALAGSRHELRYQFLSFI